MSVTHMNPRIFFAMKSIILNLWRKNLSKMVTLQNLKKKSTSFIFLWLNFNWVIGYLLKLANIHRVY